MTPSILLPALLALATPRDSGAPEAEPPRLVVLLVIDQCRPDYFERFAPRFEGFFAQLREAGRWFTEGEQHHAITVTAAGHAAIGTGRFPCRNGIVGNEFFDAALGKVVLASDDPAAGAVGGRGGRCSATRMRSDALADWWKARWPQARAIGISVKPRSAIFPLGARADQAWWIDERTAALVTSDAFVKEMPAWAADFDAHLPIDSYPKTWEPTLPDAAAFAELGCTIDDQPGESATGTNRSRTFPHSLESPRPEGRVGALLFSPWSDQLLLDFARRAVAEEKLGADESPDLLVLALSGTDYIGHRHGPDSWEICEQILHLDRALGEFFDFVDGTIGSGRTLVALSADHGVCPLPEVAATHGAAGSRVDWATVQPTVDAALRAIAPELAGAASPVGELGIRLDRAVLTKAGKPVEEVAPALAEKLRANPAFADVRSHVELQTPLAPDDRLGELLRNSSDGDRAGDLLFVLPPGTIYVPPPLTIAQSLNALPTSHGSPHPCDTAVPIVFFGPGITPARIPGRAWSVDIAPTLARAAGVPTPPDLDGHALPLTDRP